MLSTFHLPKQQESRLQDFKIFEFYSLLLQLGWYQNQWLETSAEHLQLHDSGPPLQPHVRPICHLSVPMVSGACLLEHLVVSPWGSRHESMPPPEPCHGHCHSINLYHINFSHAAPGAQLGDRPRANSKPKPFNKSLSIRGLVAPSCVFLCHVFLVLKGHTELSSYKRYKRKNNNTHTHTHTHTHTKRYIFQNIHF